MSKSPAAAARAAAAIIEGTRRLRQFPAIGRPDEQGEFYELYIPHGPGAYVLRYRLTRNRDVALVRVWASREDRS
ncbi:MAG: type II toxin-antitoxin system RelE/ParE family toxin [Myxococcales bacterium]|nr:type II toxin-antitoxin system RelE/ParE family toxin [Myxococcales bacterium]